MGEPDLDDEQALLDAARHKNRPKKRKPIDKQTAFLEFKHEAEGQGLEESIRDNRVELKAIKTAVKELTVECNAAKRNIDTVKVELDKKQDERKQSMQNQLAAADDDEILEDDEAPQEIIDEDELALLQRMKELKKTYRAAYSQLKDSKNQVSLIQQSIDQAKQQLVGQFEVWYEDSYDLGSALE